MAATSNVNAAYPPSARQGVWTNRLVWTLQILLALVFLAHGLMLLFPPASVAQQINASLPRWFSLFIGVSEVLAAVGSRFLRSPGYCPGWCHGRAAGLMIVMVSATRLHLSRREFGAAATTFVLLAMATTVAVARHQRRR